MQINLWLTFWEITYFLVLIKIKKEVDATLMPLRSVEDFSKLQC